MVLFTNSENTGAIAAEGGVATNGIFNFVLVENDSADGDKRNKLKKIIGVIIILVLLIILTSTLIKAYQICGGTGFAFISKLLIRIFDFLEGMF